MAAVRSAGLTQWSRFDVPGMWSLLRDVSTVEAFQQAGAWQSTYEAAQSLSRRLQWYRDGLAGKWSPDRSEAAAMYLGRLDELIGSAQQLADVSVANRQALVTLANAVDEARPKLQRVYEQSQALRQVDPKAGASVAVRQQQLHQQATEIMESVGSAAMDSWRHYATADDYQPPQPPTRGENSAVTGSSAVTSSASSSSSEQIAARPVRYPGQEISVSSDGGPESVGTQIASFPSESSPLASSSVEQQTVVHTSGPGLPVNRISSRGITSDAAIADGIGIAQVYKQNGIERRPLPQKSARSDDIIRPPNRGASNGGIVDTERGSQSGQDIASRGRAVNPVGGVISGEEHSGMGVTGLAGSGPLRSKGEYRRRREYDVDDPWYVAEGVSSVLAPGPEPGHFGVEPGVIGIDR